jgi:hypothetical protein
VSVVGSGFFPHPRVKEKRTNERRLEAENSTALFIAMKNALQRGD